MVITPEELIETLRQQFAPRYVVFTYQSAKGNYLAAVAKINFDYKFELHAQQLFDGQELTEPGERSWGKAVPNTPLIEHKGKFYLACWITQNITHTDADGVLQGEVLGYKDLKIENITMLAIADKIFNIRGSDVSST